jgi:hypothetical protein
MNENKNGEDKFVTLHNHDGANDQELAFKQPIGINKQNP